MNKSSPRSNNHRLLWALDYQSEIQPLLPEIANDYWAFVDSFGMFRRGAEVLFHLMSA